MPLEHALLVSLREEPASGLDLARRFDRSIGHFWHATHQQIYRVLARMERDGWVQVTTPGSGTGRTGRKVYAVTAGGDGVLAQWLASPTEPETTRSELALKMRGASFGDRAAVLAVVRDRLVDHHARLDLYLHLVARDFPEPERLEGRALDHYLVLRGGVLLEEGWIAWLTEYLQAHESARKVTR